MKHSKNWIIVTVTACVSGFSSRLRKKQKPVTQTVTVTIRHKRGDCFGQKTASQ